MLNRTPCLSFYATEFAIVFYLCDSSNSHSPVVQAYALFEGHEKMLEWKVEEVDTLQLEVDTLQLQLTILDATC